MLVNSILRDYLWQIGSKKVAILLKPFGDVIHIVDNAVEEIVQNPYFFFSDFAMTYMNSGISSIF